VSGDWPLGAVELKVLDLEREVAFYESFGLSRVSGDSEHAVLGAGGSPLLRLVALPEQELGGFLRRSLEERLPLTGTADHFVSQALYFDDAEGNGIEVYADRPRSEWQYPGGRLNIGTEHLDFERLLRIASTPEKKFSAGTVLGHMHLNVSDLDRSQSFYESLGMELMAEAGNVMRFLSWNGYHHHLGINLLEGRGAAPVTGDVRGLRGFQIGGLHGSRTDPDGILLEPPL